jgi:two-component system chemotaxis response regulator CheY
MREAEEARRQDVLLRRLSGLGLAVRPFPDGRGVAITLPLGPERFELPRGGSARFESVSFATVGSDRIKCLKPLPFFHLPLIRVGGCSTAAEFEARIRAAWRARILDLLRVRNWLEKLGLEASPEADDAPVFGFSLGAGDADARARVFEPGRVILPGRGPLTGVRLRRAEDRVFLPDPSLASGLDIELAVSSRVEELARRDARLERARMVPPIDDALPRPHDHSGTQARILLVGPSLAGDRALHESLRLRGYLPLISRSERDALRALDTASPELILAETELGRFEGIELIPELRMVPGVEEIPVVLVDSETRPERREAARRAGAAGYLVRPFEVAAIASGLASLVWRPRRRRFRRYRKQLAAQADGAARPDVVSDIGRGGMFVWTERPVELHTVARWAITLPELAATIGAEAQVLHSHTVPGAARRGLGLRFRSFDEGGEALLIRFLRAIEGGSS